ncbi:MAG: class I SAM-dependent rRNA methyltransferase, partial [Fusobacteriaceae bacterium]
MARIILEEGKEKKILNFYPNVFKDEIHSINGTVKNGDIVDVCMKDLRFIARGYVTEETSAFVRILTVKEETVDAKFILGKIKNAYDKRRHLAEETNCVRAFYSEADGIPGLIIDKFDKYISVQFRNSGIDSMRQEIINAIKKVFKPKGIYERSDVESRTIEGVEQKTGVIYGVIPEKIVMEDNGLKYTIDIVDGQKTGFFLDQRDSRKFIRPYINEQTRFLDVFSSSGGFSIAALKEGA